LPGPIDDTLKQLTEMSPGDWVVQGGWPQAPVAVIDADIATIAGATDKVLRVTGPPDWLLAVDFQAGHDALAKLPDLLLYNSALFRRHNLLVRSLLVLLHRGADSPKLTGLYERGFPISRSTWPCAIGSCGSGKCPPKNGCREAWGWCRWRPWATCSPRSCLGSSRR
jgi:hypothetical protein